MTTYCCLSLSLTNQRATPGDMCSPIVNLSVEPGTLFVHLNRNNQLVANNADNAGFRVYHGPEGAPLRVRTPLPHPAPLTIQTFWNNIQTDVWRHLQANYKDTSSSLTLRGLVSGQRYCVQVGFTLYGKAYGPPSCIRCLLVPHAGEPVFRTRRGQFCMTNTSFVLFLTWSLFSKVKPVKQWVNRIGVFTCWVVLQITLIHGQTEGRTESRGEHRRAVEERKGERESNW